MLLRSLIVAALLSVAPDPAPLDEPGIWSEAAALEEAGSHAEARRAFAPLADAYPQDYAIQLQAAWLSFLAGDWADAELRYTRAIELSEGAPLARAGLAWTHLRQGRKREAKREFEAVLAEQPELASAREGLDEIRRRRFSITPNAFGIGHVYSGHPTLAWAVGLSAQAPMVVAEHLLITPGYRYARFYAPVVRQGMGMMAGRGGTTQAPPFDQHEAHMGLGGTWPRVGFLARYAYLHDGSALANHAHVAGLSLRYSPWGDGYLDGSAAMFASSGWVGRVAPSWRMPATRWLAFRPGFAVQFLNRSVLPSGFANVIVHGPRAAVVFGGKGGLEERPVYLETPAIFAFAGRIIWGAWVAGDLHLARGVSLHASYETHRLRAPTDTGGVAPTQIHYVALGLSWSSAAADAHRARP